MRIHIAYLFFLLIVFPLHLFSQTSVLPFVGGMVNYSLFEDIPKNTFLNGLNNIEQNWVLVPFIGLSVEQQILKRFEVGVNGYISRIKHEEIAQGGFVGNTYSMYTTNTFQADIQCLFLLYSNLHISSGVRLMNVRFSKRLGDESYPNSGTWTWAVSSQKGIHFIGYVGGVSYDIGALKLGINYVSLTKTKRNDSAWTKNKAFEMTISYRIQILKKGKKSNKTKCPKF